jgi:hypothetical protein
MGVEEGHDIYQKRKPRKKVTSMIMPAKHWQSRIRVQAGIGNTYMFTRPAYITAKVIGYQERRIVFYWTMGPHKPARQSGHGGKHQGFHLISTVRENHTGYTQRQFEQATAARELYCIVGTPTIKKFNALLKMNAIKNCLVMPEDVNIAKKIFGKDMSSLKGNIDAKKSTHGKAGYN